MSVELRSNELRGLIREVARSGITLSVDGAELRYRATRGEMPPEIRTRLQARKEELIAELSRPRFRKRGLTTDVVRFPPYWIDFYHETAGNPSVANLTHFVLRLDGVSVSSLEAAVETVRLRHGLLRGRIETIDGTPCVLLDSSGPAPLEVIDLMQGESASSPEITQALQRAIWAPLDPLSVFRVCAVKTSPRELLVACVIHHFVCDFPSCQIIARELLSALRGRSPATEIPPSRPIQYADYLAAIDEWLAGPGGCHRVAYWKDKMAGVPTVRLPRCLDSPVAGRPPVESASFRVEEPLRTALAKLATDVGVTVATVMLAGSFAALWSALRSSDLVNILIASGREDPALLGLVGPTVNCFPVRVTVSAQMTCRNLIEHVRHTYLIAQDYQIPWAVLMRMIPPREISFAAPVFNFIAGRGAAARVNSFLATAPDSERMELRRPAETPQVGWMSHELNVVDSGNALAGTVRYAPANHEAGTIRRFIDSLVRFLSRAADDPDALIQ